MMLPILLVDVNSAADAFIALMWSVGSYVSREIFPSRFTMKWNAVDSSGMWSDEKKNAKNLIVKNYFKL